MWYVNKPYTNRPLLTSCMKPKSLRLKIPGNHVVDIVRHTLALKELYIIFPHGEQVVPWLRVIQQRIYSSRQYCTDAGLLLVWREYGTVQQLLVQCYCGSSGAVLVQYWFGAAVILIRCGCGTCVVRVRCCTYTVRYVNVLLLSTVQLSASDSHVLTISLANTPLVTRVFSLPYMYSRHQN